MKKNKISGNYPKVVILTGGIASGKSTVSAFFEEFNIEVIDMDKISYSLTTNDGKVLEKLREEFDAKFFKVDGSLNKEKVRNEIFLNKKLKLKLERILHPMIAKEAKLATLSAVGPYIVHVVPLWVEINKKRKSDIWKVVVVDCPENIQRIRAFKRSTKDAETFDRIKSHQVSRTARLAAADLIIDNDGSLESLREKSLKVHNYLLNNA